MTTYTAYENPFSNNRIDVVNNITGATVGCFVNWAAAATWFVISDEMTVDAQGIEGFAATAVETLPAIIPVSSLWIEVAN